MIKKISFLFFLTLLTSCKTLEDRVDLGEGGLKSAAKSFTSSINPFEKKANEYKKLIADKKYEDADSFLKNNKEFFDKRYQKNRSLIEEEVKELSDYLFEKNYKEEIQVAKLKLGQIKSLNNIDEWKSHHTNMQMASSVLARLKDSYSVSLNIANYKDAQELKSLLDQTAQRVRNSKSASINQTFAAVYETNYPNKEYFGIGYDAVDYQRSLEYQKFAEEKFIAIVFPQQFKEKASSQFYLLDAQTKDRLNTQYLKLIKQELNRDGKITFEEVINLAKNISLPFSSSNTNFDDLVKIGYIDLDDKVNQTNDSFDISLKQDTTLKINNLFAQNTNRIEDIDFLIATRVSLKKVARQIISRNDVQSTYKSGERQEQNPNYATAFSNHQLALANVNRAQINSANNNRCQNATQCMLLGLANGIAEAGASKSLQDAAANLAATPQLLTIPVYQNYRYKKSEIEITKSARIEYFIVDVKDKKFYKDAIPLIEKQKFIVLENVNDNDPNRSSITNRTKTPDDLSGWEKEPLTLGFSTFVDSNLPQKKTAQKFNTLADLGSPNVSENISAASKSDASPSVQAVNKNSVLELQATTTSPDKNGVVTIFIKTNANTKSLIVNGVEQGAKKDGIYSLKRMTKAGQNNYFEILATDFNGNVDSKTLEVQREVTREINLSERLTPDSIKTAKSSDAVAIIIGIQDYERVPKAEYANEDAKVFHEYAKRALGIRPENIKLLIDKDAGQADILKTFRTWLPAKMREKKADLFVFYSGHGLPTPDGKSLYFMPYGVDRDVLEDSAIEQNKIVAIIESVKPKSVTFFIDSCYSGASRSGETLIASARPLALKTNSVGFPKNYTVFTASNSDQISSSSASLNHGVFSFYLMKALEGGADSNRDGQLTLGELQGYLFDKVSSFATTLNRRQEPQFIGDSAKVLVGR